MNEKLNNLEEQLNAIRKGLFKMGPSRIRAMSTHETDDLLVELEKVADDALKTLAELKQG